MATKAKQRKKKANTVKLYGTKCELQFGYYQSNNTIAIQAVRKSNGDLMGDLTINYEDYYRGLNYAKDHQFPLVVIKNYDENKGIYKELIEAGIILEGPYLTGSDGTVQLAKLTEEWQAIAKKQLDEIVDD